MKRILTQTHRDKAGISLLFIVVLLFFINATRNSNTATIEESFESVYKDRLVVDDYIFRISRLVEYKRDEISGVYNNTLVDSNQIYDSINVLLRKYAATEFTNDEEIYFTDLRIHLVNMQEFEVLFNTTKSPELRNTYREGVNENALAVLHELEILSEIQFVEAGNLFKKSNNRIQHSFLVSKLEMALWVVVCIIGMILLAPNPVQKIINAKLQELN